MKFLKRRKSLDSANVDMTSMLDIVFIMLIFFIVTAIFLDETGLDFTLPGSDSPACSDCGPTIQIYVDSKDHISVDRVRVQLNGVSGRVERLLADKPNANILLMADKDASLDPVVSIKDQMNQAGRNSIVKVIR